MERMHHQNGEEILIETYLITIRLYECHESGLNHIILNRGDLNFRNPIGIEELLADSWNLFLNDSMILQIAEQLFGMMPRFAEYLIHAIPTAEC
jgi:hypothetical protein